MSQLLNLVQATFFLNKLRFYDGPKFLQQKSCLYLGKYAQLQKYQDLQLSLQGEVVVHVECLFKCKAYLCSGGELDAFPHIQTLRKFPKEELDAKAVLVRFDSAILLREEQEQQSQLVSNALFTIKYLYESGAKVVLASDWCTKINPKLIHAESVADFLSSILKCRVVPVCSISCRTPSKREGLEKADILLLENLSEFKEEVANCSKFAQLLSWGIDIFVNDSFSLSHKILASTVGVARFCHSCVAGFHFEESLCQLKKVAETSGNPYVAVIGGGNLYQKAAALHFLASRCDGLVFIGKMSFQIMHALGLSVPLDFVEYGALNEVLDIAQIAYNRNTQILYPKDFWCKNDCFPGKLELFPSDGILDGWVPVDLGPVSLDEINSLLTKCKKVLWIGPLKFSDSNQHTNGSSPLTQMLDILCRRKCDLTVVGSMAEMKKSSSDSDFNMLVNASVVWEFLKGRKLPGVMALDRAYPFEINWNATYCDPTQPLVVDIGSGNGLFIMGMARKRTDLNFLGLEINEKLTRRCVASVQRSGIKNGYFIATNATSTFRSIVSSYPGDLVLVSIQCPNPDFNKPEHRWRMLQRTLVEAVVDLLTSDGKVFLQSDIEAVAVRMREQFLKYGKGKLSVMHDEGDTKSREGWLEENPFGVRSDWEQHVIYRGAPMYRLMLSKSTNIE
ncbi:phosphoglycerate kinase-like [Juglans microcarpa x Juglans regia]|uniref:phosphoglycerate kinase-like n=1 Tax=Juglans microcarpa x Juglans regia TaxID=2249226 RepID=UPI001B7DFFD2|nr:phosphoglycerate kinase-like [Juglans microcarpa x Juglans regia]